MRPSTGRWAMIATLAAACSTDANYTLRLVPHVPLNQSPFDGAPQAHLRLRDADGNIDWVGLGELGSGTHDERGFGPLDRHTIGLALGGDDPDQSLEGIFAWGETTPVSLDTGREERRADVLLAEIAKVGTLGDLATPSLGAAAAVLSTGEVYLFGGAPRAGAACTTSIRKLPSLQTAEWSFERVNDSLPEPMCHAVATVVDIDGVEQIVITGGESTHDTHNERINAVSIFDPATDSIVWTGEGFVTRARHAVQTFPGGRLLIVGASQNGSTGPNQATFETFDVAEQDFVDFGPVQAPPWDFMSAPLSTSMAICGGATWSGSTVTPAATCLQIDAEGVATSFPELPIPLRAASMARLSDGRLLVAGGITVTGSAGDALPTVASAFVLDPSQTSPSWSPVDDLSAPRAYGRLVADAFGGAVLVGGIEAGWGFGGGRPVPPLCGERFLPDGSWEPLQGCANAGTGLLPAAALSPGGLIFLVEGGKGTDAGGGEAYGVIGLGP